MRFAGNRRDAAAKVGAHVLPLASDTAMVAIGASPGDIEALIELLRHLPADTGMTFVVVPPFDPIHHGILTQSLVHRTAMMVVEASDGTRLQPNHLYVIAPDCMMALSNCTFRVSLRNESLGTPMPVDHFMRSLAEQHGNRAIGIILSGSGSDGALGAAEIQHHGGITFAQELSSARHAGMPRSAIATGRVDYVLSPAAIAQELARIASHSYLSRDSSSTTEDPSRSTTPQHTSQLRTPQHTARPDRPRDTAESSTAGQTSQLSLHLKTLFESLRRATGVDFTDYRKTVVLRRVHRRMLIHKIANIADFVNLVVHNPAMQKAVCNDMLIKVTRFFRDADTFETLKSVVFPELCSRRPPERGIRVWIPGCGSGEEVYSVAIALLEFIAEKSGNLPIQLFGTDVSESSIAKAREGVYPENIQGDVSPERLRRYFTKAEGGYRASKSIRDMCVFAQHNVLKDAPFSMMDLVCCRNLLMHFELSAQSKVISLFHYALRPSGFLVLGSGEDLVSGMKLFRAENRAHGIFSKKNGAIRPRGFPAIQQYTVGNSLAGRKASAQGSNWTYVDRQKEFDRRILNQYVPATVFVNEDMDIIHSRGSVNRYLKLAPGRASLNLLKMASDGLLGELRIAIARAKKENTGVGKRNLQIRDTSDAANENGPKPAKRRVNFDVIPVTLGDLKEMYFMIVFQDAPMARRAITRWQVRNGLGAANSRQITTLERELAATKEYLQSVLETQEASNEELQCANEEILSSNEELQSSNEELENAREELQSNNEELHTVNCELQSRNQQLTEINSDFVNLFSSIELALIMIGSDLRIRRFTVKAQELLGLIASDVGTPLSELDAAVKIEEMAPMVQQVMTDLQAREQELTDHRGTRYRCKVLPCRSIDDKADGALITIADPA